VKKLFFVKFLDIFEFFASWWSEVTCFGQFVWFYKLIMT